MIRLLLAKLITICYMKGDTAMDAFEAIVTRRSIRKYTGDPISAETLDKLLEAGMCAPSAGNERPWHFIIVSERDTLDEIPLIHPYARMIKEAQVAILVCGDISLELYDGYWVQDCAAAVENILIAANSMGLGAVWLGIYPVEERVIGFRKLFGIPANVYPFAVIPLGVPGETKPFANRFDKTRVRKEKWNK